MSDYAPLNFVVFIVIRPVFLVKSANFHVVFFIIELVLSLGAVKLYPNY